MIGVVKDMRTVEVKLEDDYGAVILTVQVEMAISTIIEGYGEDADGNRGQYREEVLADPGCAYIHPRYLQHMTSAQVEEVLRLAKEKLEEGK